MKTRANLIALACIVIFGAMLACNLPTTVPTVSNIRMATDETGATPTSTYAPGDAFYVYADLSGLTKGATVEARWYAVNVQGEDPNTMINTSDFTYDPQYGHIYFQLTTSDGADWPIGSYKVELYLDGNRVGEQTFTVQ